MRSKEEIKIYKRDYIRGRAAKGKASRVYSVIKGKSKRLVFPEGTIEELRSRLEIDETSKTGLRWKDVDKNKKNLIGKPAGGLGGSNGTYFIICNICIQGNLYAICVSHIVWMLATNKMIEAGFVVNHKNRIRTDNRFENLTLETINSNSTNRKSLSFSGYKNVHIFKRIDKTGKETIRYIAKFCWVGFEYWTVMNHLSAHACYVFLLGWELLTSGAVPLACVKSQTDEYLCGSDLKRALKECKKQGIAVKRPKYKTLYEYIASVEGSC